MNKNLKPTKLETEVKMENKIYTRVLEKKGIYWTWSIKRSSPGTPWFNYEIIANGKECETKEDAIFESAIPWIRITRPKEFRENIPKPFEEK